MDIVDTSLKTVDSTLTGVLSNPTYYGILAIFLAMYGPRLSPKLPSVVRDMFNNNYFRFAVILLVIFMSNNDLSMALIITIAFVLVMSLANSQEIEEKFTQNNKEGFSDFDSIREFYEEEEEEGFENNPPEESPESNNEDFEDSPEEENDEMFEDTPEESDEMFEDTPEESNELFENTPEGEMNTENFTPYEKQLYSVVNNYKFGN